MPTQTSSPLQQFRSKAVCKLFCKDCDYMLCYRGMKAMLLANTKVELYSTDCSPYSVQLVGRDYVTSNCSCRIRDVACLGCGNISGYHITQPCSGCMESCNNGHFWMFHTKAVYSEDRSTIKGDDTLVWAYLPCPDLDFANLNCESKITYFALAIILVTIQSF